MQRVMTVGAAEHQPLLRSVLRAAMPTAGTGLTGIVSIDLDGHTLLQNGFIGDHAMKLGKAPLGVGRIGLPLLLGRLLALLATSAFPNMSQLFQPDQAMGMTLDDAFGHNMVGVLFQPSLSSADRHQAAGRRASAFFLKTLA